MRGDRLGLSNYAWNPLADTTCIRTCTVVPVDSIVHLFDYCRGVTTSNARARGTMGPTGHAKQGFVSFISVLLALTTEAKAVRRGFNPLQDIVEDFLNSKLRVEPETPKFFDICEQSISTSVSRQSRASLDALCVVLDRNAGVLGMQESCGLKRQPHALTSTAIVPSRKEAVSAHS